MSNFLPPPDDPGSQLWSETAAKGNREFETLRLADVRHERVEWLWRHHLPAGKLTIIAGHPGHGKTWLTADLAARITTGRGWPDTPDETQEPGGVLIINGEDGIGDTLVPRLAAANADMSRVHAVPLLGERGAPAIRWWTLAEPNRLESWIEECDSCRAVFIDPVGAFMGERDDNSNGAVRGMLGPLADLASRRGIAIVLVSHLAKSGSRSAQSRFLGSVAWTGGPRAAWLVMRDREDDSRRMFLPVKNNLAPSVPGRAYRIEGTPPRIEWELGSVTITADEAIEMYQGDGDDEAAAEVAVDVARELLAGGREVAATEIFAAGEKRGIRPKAMRRAMKSLQATKRKDGFRGGWLWSISQAGAASSPKMPKVRPVGHAESSASWHDREPETPEWARTN